MRNKALTLILTSSMLCSGLAQAQVSTRGADGPAAVTLFAELLANSVSSDSISCDADHSQIADDLVSQNVKLVSLAKKSKDVKKFLKLLGFEGNPNKKDFVDNLFKDAALEAVDTILCSGDDFVDPAPEE